LSFLSWCRNSEILDCDSSTLLSSFFLWSPFCLFFVFLSKSTFLPVITSGLAGFVGCDCFTSRLLLRRSEMVWVSVKTTFLSFYASLSSALANEPSVGFRSQSDMDVLSGDGVDLFDRFDVAPSMTLTLFLRYIWASLSSVNCCWEFFLLDFDTLMLTLGPPKDSCLPKLGFSSI